MSTRVSVLFGEIITDNSVHHAVPLPAGLFEMGTPSISPSSGSGPWTAYLNPGGDRNELVWREVGSGVQGRMTIQEDAALSFTIAAADGSNPRIDLLVGCHQWVDGSRIPGCMTSGQPNGTMDASMFPYYTVVQGTPSATPSAPTPLSSYSGPAGTGGPPVILAQVYVPAAGQGQPTISPWLPTDCRWMTQSAYYQEIVNARGGYSDLNSRLAALGDGFLPPGLILPYAGGGAPAGWLLCNGGIVTSRTGIYAALWNIIGTTYGNGNNDGLSFTVPDLRGKFPLGVGPTALGLPATTPSLGATGGESTHTLITQEMPSHVHGLVNQIGGNQAQGLSNTSSGGSTESQTPNTGPAGGDGAHNNMPPWLAVNYIIKL